MISTAVMAPVLVGKESKPKSGTVLYRGKPDLVAEIDRIAARLNLSRNEAITQLLEFAVAEHVKETKKARATFETPYADAVIARAGSATPVTTRTKLPQVSWRRVNKGVGRRDR